MNFACPSATPCCNTLVNVQPIGHKTIYTLATGTVTYNPAIVPVVSTMSTPIPRCTPAVNANSVCEYDTWSEQIQMCIDAGDGSITTYYRTDNGTLPR